MNTPVFQAEAYQPAWGFNLTMLAGHPYNASLAATLNISDLGIRLPPEIARLADGYTGFSARESIEEGQVPALVDMLTSRTPRLSAMTVRDDYRELPVGGRDKEGLLVHTRVINRDELRLQRPIGVSDVNESYLAFTAADSHRDITVIHPVALGYPTVAVWALRDGPRAIRQQNA